jgi:hypothetical protein
MNSRGRAVLGAVVLCALGVYAFAAVGASAAGLTAVECKNVGGASKYSTSECLTPATGGEFNTVAIANGVGTPIENTSTTASHVTGSTASPVTVFHSTLAGVEITLTCGNGKHSGTITNKEEAGEMRIHGTGGVSTWTECHTSPRTKPTKICTVQGVAPATPVGTLQTNKLTSISGPEHRVTITPEAGESFLKLKINASGGECFAAASLEVTVTGSSVGRVDTTTHSHMTFDEASNALGALKTNGAVSSQTETVRKTSTTGTLLGAESFGSPSESRGAPPRLSTQR